MNPEYNEKQLSEKDFIEDIKEDLKSAMEVSYYESKPAPPRRASTAGKHIRINILFTDYSTVTYKLSKELFYKYFKVK